MNSTVKKLMSLMLAGGLMLSVAACGSGDTGSAASSKAAESTASTAGGESAASASTAAGGDANFNETGYPIVNEPVTLDVLVSKHSLTDPFPDLKVFQDLEAKTNVKVNWQYAEGEDWSTQKPLLLASGDLPDVFMGASLSESDVINNSELFLDMTSYIEKYGTNIKTMFEESPSMKAMATAYDGKIYGLPHQMPCRPSTFDMGFINQKWLDNLKLKMPTTLDELETVLTAFKEQDANGNGNPNDEIPLSFMAFNDLTGCLSLYASFGTDVVESLNGKYVSLTDGKVKYVPIQDGFKEGTKYLQKLYSKGLIDVEAFTQDWSIYPAKLNPEGDSIVGMGFHWSILTGVGQGRADEYAPLMPVKGPGGDQFWRHNPDSVKSGKYYFEVAASCENPEIAIRWGDAIYDQEVSMQLFYGAIGTTMEKKDDGTYEVLPPAEGLNSETWAWKFSMGDQNAGYVGDTFSTKITPPIDVKEKLEADKEYEKYLKKEYYPLVNLTKEQSDELSTLSTDLNTYFKETISGWIVNGGDIDAEWGSYVDQMKKMGSDKYTEIYQQAYDSYK